MERKYQTVPTEYDYTRLEAAIELLRYKMRFAHENISIEDLQEVIVVAGRAPEKEIEVI